MLNLNNVKGDAPKKRKRFMQEAIASSVTGKTTENLITLEESKRKNPRAKPIKSQKQHQKD